MNNYTFIEPAAVPPEPSWGAIIGGILLAVALVVGVAWLLEQAGKKNNRQ